MATNTNVTLKRYNGSDYDTIYPKTIPSQVVGLLGVDSKISESLLPNTVFDNLHFYGTVTTSNTLVAMIADSLEGDLIDMGMTQDQAIREIIGYYWVATNTTVLTANPVTASDPASANNIYYKTLFSIGDSSYDTSATTQTLETGDWILVNSIIGSGTVGSPYTVKFVVINNTYETATTALNGIVKLSAITSTAGASGNNVITDGILAGLVGTAAGKLAAGDHNHNGTYQPADNDLTAIGSLSGTSGLLRKTNTDTWVLDTATYLTSQSTDFKTVTVTDTDTGFTWTSTGSSVADTTGDTLTVVSGTGIDVDVDAGSDAIRITHADTSTLTGAQGTAGIASITVDGLGHVTAVTTATYNNYSLPLAADGVRGGIQIGATETETNRAVVLSSEKAYIALPRQIPAVTLNGSSSTSPSFYAPTAAGVAGSTTQTKQLLVAGGSSVAPSWVDFPKTYYADTEALATSAGATLGDILIEY